MAPLLDETKRPIDIPQSTDCVDDNVRLAEILRQEQTTGIRKIRQKEIVVQRKDCITRMWANAQRDGRSSEYRWRPLLNAAKFG